MKKHTVLLIMLFLLVPVVLGACRGGTADIQGIEWQWVSLRETLPASQSLNPDAENYTITFMDDENVSIKADCNMVLGTYTVSGSSMTIQTGPSTLAFCGEESQDVFYLGLIAQVGSYEIEDGSLLLGLADDAGTMGFKNAGAAE
jgi:heat shock protein HslJ